MNVLEFKTKFEKNAVKAKKSHLTTTLIFLNNLWIKLLRKVLVGRVIYLKNGDSKSHYFHMVEFGRFGGSMVYSGQVTSDPGIRLWKLTDKEEADDILSRYILNYNCSEVDISKIPGMNVTIDNLPPHVNMFKEKAGDKVIVCA